MLKKDGWENKVNQTTPLQIQANENKSEAKYKNINQSTHFSLNF